MLCMDNLSSHGGKGSRTGATKARREQEKVDYSRGYHKNVDQWQQRKEKRRMMGWVAGATP